MRKIEIHNEMFRFKISSNTERASSLFLAREKKPLKSSLKFMLITKVNKSEVNFNKLSDN